MADMVREAAERVAATDPFIPTETSEGIVFVCLFCRWRPVPGRAERHWSDCPWVDLRAALGQPAPAEVR